MKVFVTGATGELGRPAVRALVHAGHGVTGVARTAPKAELLGRLGARSLRIDLFDRSALEEAVVGHDAVLHFATKIPALEDAWRAAAWRENDRLRTETTRELVDAALTAGVPTLLLESITFLYADGGDRWLEEDAPLARDNDTLRSMLHAEAELARFTEGGGRGITLRFGSFYGPEAAHTKDVLAAYGRRGRAAIVGSQEGYISSIHTEDAGRAAAAALDLPAGVYNIVDDEPMTRAAYVEAFGRALGVEPPHLMAEFLGRLIPRTGPTRRSHRVSNRRFRAASMWRPEYPSVREGWPSVVGRTV